MPYIRYLASRKTPGKAPGEIEEVPDAKGRRLCKSSPPWAEYLTDEEAAEHEASLEPADEEGEQPEVKFTVAAQELLGDREYTGPVPEGGRRVGVQTVREWLATE